MLFNLLFAAPEQLQLVRDFVFQYAALCILMPHPVLNVCVGLYNCIQIYCLEMETHVSSV